MDKTAVVNELTTIIEEYLKDKGFELVELIYRREGRDMHLRILIDRPSGGISLGECATFNREIGNLLDEKGILEEGYILEVSSPGVDRPLKTKNDFLRCIDKRVRFLFSEPVGGKWEREGMVKRAGDDSVYIEIDGAEMDIPLSKINKAIQAF